MSALISSQWLEEHLTDSNLIVLDASMATVVGREPIVYDQLTCIPGALQFDLENDYFDHQSPQLHAMPSAAQFGQAIARLGITPDCSIVIYDNQGIYSAPRAWYTFRVMGYNNVKILDGGLPQWLEEGRPVTDRHAQTKNPLATAQVTPDAALLCDAQQVLNNIQNGDFNVLDARSDARFYGQAPEPRAGVRGGHIPGSINLPFAQVLDNHQMKTAGELLQQFQSKGLSPDQPLVFSCGSGITACIILLAAQEAGYNALALYDGSWADWGSNPDLPVTTDR